MDDGFRVVWDWSDLLKRFHRSNEDNDQKVHKNQSLTSTLSIFNLHYTFKDGGLLFTIKYNNKRFAGIAIEPAIQ